MVLGVCVDDRVELLVTVLLVEGEELLLDELDELLDELDGVDELVLLVAVIEAASDVDELEVATTATLGFFGAREVVAGSSEDGGLEVSSPAEPSVLKTTIFAVEPLGTVTTQKSAPPAPEAAVALLTNPKPSELGSMAQGRPLQFPSHSTFRPKEGLTP